MSPEARHRFARNTCNGCHTFSETAGAEFNIRPRFPFQEAQLSGFLLGGDVNDFQAGVIRHFNELGRRGRILHDLVCPQEMLPPLPPDTTPIGGGVGGTGGGVGGRGGGTAGTVAAGDGRWLRRHRGRRADRRPRRRHPDRRRWRDREVTPTRSDRRRAGEAPNQFGRLVGLSYLRRATSSVARSGIDPRSPYALALSRILNMRIVWQ